MADRDGPRSRHAEALAALVEERYHRMVRYAAKRLCCRDVPQSSADPQDVVQNVLKSVLALDEPIDNVRAYVYRCMERETDRAAQRYRLGRGYASLDADVRPEDEPVVEPIAEAEVRHVLDEALANLPLQQRRVVLLTRELGMTQAEAAQVLGSASGTVGVHAHRAIRALRVTLVGLGTALVVWTTWFVRFGEKKIIPAAGPDSPAVIMLSLTSVVGLLLIALVVLLARASGDVGIRWRDVMRAVGRALEPAPESPRDSNVMWSSTNTFYD